MTSSPTASSIAAAPPPVVARSTAVRRRGFGFRAVNDGPDLLPYCLGSGALERFKFGLGSWLRQRAQVQPGLSPFATREENVGFNIFTDRGRSLAVSVQVCHEERIGISRTCDLGGLSTRPCHTPARNFESDLVAFATFLGNAPRRVRVTPGQTCPLNFMQG